ncbi:MAG: glycosyltransferase, partial [Steroidobacteraceae bacterium]|nr:glycosyltransferase [Steroidobacteraceae bacterium]
MSFPRVNGVSTSIATFRRDLHALGHRTLLIAPAYPGQSMADDPDTLRIVSHAVPRDPEDRLMSRSVILKLLPRLVDAELDLVHIQTPFTAHYAGIEIERRLGLPVVESYHTYFEHYLQHYVPLLPARWLRALSRRFTVRQCSAVDAIIAPSEPMAAVLRGYGVRTPIHVIPTGLGVESFRAGDAARFRAIERIEDRPLALYVGRVAYEKNIEFLLDMLEPLRRRVPNVLLMIAGQGPAEAHLKAEVARRGLGAHVRFIGYLDRDSALLDCYRAADVFVFASRTETQGLVLLEALAQGTPVVSTAVMGTAEVLAGTEGALIAPEDAAVFAAAVAQVLENRELRERLSRAAVRDAARWSSERCAQRV